MFTVMPNIILYKATNAHEMIYKIDMKKKNCLNENF